MCYPEHLFHPCMMADRTHDAGPAALHPERMSHSGTTCMIKPRSLVHLGQGRCQIWRTSAPASRSSLANCVALLTSAQVSAVPCSSSTGGSDSPQATPCNQECLMRHCTSGLYKGMHKVF